MPKIVADDTPQHLRPFLFHGLDLVVKGEQATGQCPFCGKPGKFSVQVSTGLWRCFVCGAGSDKGGGNAVTFLRVLWERSKESTTVDSYKELAEDRGLLSPDTVSHWGICRSEIDGCWLVPGYTTEGKVGQLYKWDIGKSGKRILFATRGLPTQPMGIVDEGKSTVYLTEGPWDAMALWEALSLAKQTDSGVKLTSNPSASFLKDSSVLAIPGCGGFQQFWCKMLAGKRVIICFDNDHPKNRKSKNEEGPALAGTKRTVRLLLSAEEPPSEILWLRWGEAGYDPDLPDGCDVRDALKAGRNQADRVKALSQVLELIQPVPDEWIDPQFHVGHSNQQQIEPEECKSWLQVRDAWKRALDWRQALDDTLSVMLAVAISTDRAGDSQLFLQVIGDPGSAKTRLCDGLLVSKHCFALEHLTGFHSGWKSSDGEDYSLLARINHKTLITPEGDTLVSSPSFTQIMSQQRRIFDGTSGASYKNRKEEMRYTGLRTPWIIAGTPALLSVNQSSLGDRFIRIFIDQPDEDGRRSILRRVGFTALRSVMQASNCRQESIIEGNLLKAYKLTGGYVNHLRANVDELIAMAYPKDEEDELYLVERCSDLAEFTAFMRARPDPDTRKMEVHDAKELPTRLTHQFVRLAVCLAAVMGRPIDSEVLRRVRKVALDTSMGQSLVIAKKLWNLGEDGGTTRQIAVSTGRNEEKEGNLMAFMRRIGALEQRLKKINGSKQTRWSLSRKMRHLWINVMENKNG